MTDNKDKTDLELQDTPVNIDGAGDLLKQTQGIFFKKIKPLVTDYFDKVDNILLQLSKKSDSLAKKKLYSEALKSIRVYKLNVLSSFLKSLKQNFIFFENHNFNYFEDKVVKVVSKKQSVTDKIDKDDVMEKMAQNSLTHECEHIYRQELIILQKQFAYIISQDVNLYQIPVGPYVLVSSFAKSIRLLHLDLKIKLVLYKHFERSIMSVLEDMYIELHTSLSDNLKLKGEKTQSKQVEKEDALKKTQEEQNFTLNILTTLQQKCLTEFSKNNVWPFMPEQVRNQALEQIKKSPRSISPVYKETIKLVTMLFQVIVDDRDIPETITNLLVKLQIPYIKAAILDENLISNKSHPAQNLLESISSKFIGWSPETDTDNHFINKLKVIVDHILHENQLTAIYFQELDQDFNSFIEEHKNSFKKEQQRVMDKTAGRDKIVSSMKTVEALLAHKMEDVEIPDVIRNILLGPWKNVLALLLVRESNTSENYLKMVNFIDNVIKALAPKQIEMVMQQNINKLCVDYGEGLKLVAYSGVELAKKKEELHLSLLKLHNLEDKRKDMDYICEESSQGPIKTTESLYEAVKHIDYTKTTPDLKDLNPRDQKTLANVSIGKWLSFTDEDDEVFDAKLSWISPRSGKFLFVNSKGLKTLDKTPQELARGLNNGSIRLKNQR